MYATGLRSKLYSLTLLVRPLRAPCEPQPLAIDVEVRNNGPRENLDVIETIPTQPAVVEVGQRENPSLR